MIIDAHVHLPVTEGCYSLQQKKNRLLHEMANNGVDQSIVISDSTLESTIGTLDECMELLRETENVFVIGGISPFYEFQTQLNKLRTYLEEKSVVGIKLFTGHEAFYLTDERIKEVYEIAIQYNVPVLFHSGWTNSQYGGVDQAAEIAKRYPKLKLVCCHCFYPEIERCMRLVSYQNVYFDLSSIADDSSKMAELSKMLTKLIAEAPKRVIFGSDYSCCSQQQHIQFIKSLNLEKSVENDVFWRNAQTVYL